MAHHAQRFALAGLGAFVLAGCLDVADAVEQPANDGSVAAGAGGLADASWLDGASGGGSPSGGAPAGGSGGAPTGGGGTLAGGAGGAPSGGGTGGAPSGGTGGVATGGTGGSGGAPTGGSGGTGGGCPPVAKVTAALAPTNATNSAALGTEPWTAPVNAIVSDGTSASVLVKQTQVSNALLVTGFGAAIPANATVTGVIVSVKRFDLNQIVDHSLTLSSQGAAIGSNHASPIDWKTQIPETVTYGGASDTWGVALSPGTVNAADFGVALAVKSGDATNVFPQSARVDAITVTIHYSAPGC